MSPHEKVCNNCKWFDINDYGRYSICRHNPPTVVVITGTLRYIWCEVEGADWCGQWKEKSDK